MIHPKISHPIQPSSYRPCQRHQPQHQYQHQYSSSHPSSMFHYHLNQWRSTQSLDPHHQLLIQVLAEVNAYSSYEDSLESCLEYPFPHLILVNPPPVWVPVQRVLQAHRTPIDALQHEAPHPHLVFLPQDPACQNPAHQYLMKLTADLSKVATLETIKTLNSLDTRRQNGDTSHLKTSRHAHLLIQKDTPTPSHPHDSLQRSDLPPDYQLPSREMASTHCPWICRRRATCSHCS